MTKKSIALQLTAYERFGTVNRESYLEWYADEVINYGDAFIIAHYNDYLTENGYEPYYDDFEDMLSGMSTTEAIRCTYFGDFCFNADYHQFNGYGNIDSYSDTQVLNELKTDNYFLLWYMENYCDIDEDEVVEVCELANELLRQGY